MWKSAIEWGAGSFILVLGLPLFSSLCVLVLVFLPPWWSISSTPSMPAGSNQGRGSACFWKDVPPTWCRGLKANIFPCLWDSSSGNANLQWAFLNFSFNEHNCTHIWDMVQYFNRGRQCIIISQGNQHFHHLQRSFLCVGSIHSPLFQLL